MLNKIYCSRCKAMEPGPAVKVPGPSLGAITVDQIVCRDCQSEHQEHMENNFWRGAACSEHGQCPKCKDGLTSQNSRPVYRRANNDGAWEVVLVCDCCHADYQKCCAAAAK